MSKVTPITPKHRTKTLPVQMPIETWATLKKLSTETEISMTELVKEGIAYIFKKYNKKIPQNT